MSEENKAAVRRYFEEAWSAGNVDVLDELLSPDYVDHDPQDPHAETPGPEGTKQALAMYREAFPDLSISIEEQFADGDVVITRWTASGTHEGDLPGLAATHRRSTVSGISIDRFEGGRIVEGWTNWDTRGLLQQLGAVPAATGS